MVQLGVFPGNQQEIHQEALITLALGKTLLNMSPETYPEKSKRLKALTETFWGFLGSCANATKQNMIQSLKPTYPVEVEFRGSRFSCGCVFLFWGGGSPFCSVLKDTQQNAANLGEAPNHLCWDGPMYIIESSIRFLQFVPCSCLIAAKWS